jgi:hypothetical protein
LTAACGALGLDVARLASEASRTVTSRTPELIMSPARPRLFFFAAPLAAGALLGTLPARADIPPPEDYVEGCTLESHQSDATECVACPSGRENGTACSDAHSPGGYAKVCQTYGATTFTEIWCRARTSAPPVPSEPPAPTAEGGEADAGETPVVTTGAPETETAGGGCAGGGGTVGLLASALALFMRRRG